MKILCQADEKISESCCSWTLPPSFQLLPCSLFFSYFNNKLWCKWLLLLNLVFFLGICSHSIQSCFFFPVICLKGQIVNFRIFSLLSNISSSSSLFVNVALLVITSSGMYQPINTSKSTQKSPCVFLKLFVVVWLGTWWYFSTAPEIVFTCLALAFCPPSMSSAIFFFSLGSLKIYFSSQSSSVSFPW